MSKVSTTQMEVSEIIVAYILDDAHRSFGSQSAD